MVLLIDAALSPSATAMAYLGVSLGSVDDGPLPAAAKPLGTPIAAVFPMSRSSQLGGWLGNVANRSWMATGGVV